MREAAAVEPSLSGALLAHLAEQAQEAAVLAEPVPTEAQPVGWVGPAQEVAVWVEQFQPAAQQVHSVEPAQETVVQTDPSVAMASAFS